MSSTDGDDRRGSAEERLPSGVQSLTLDDFVFPIDELTIGEKIAAGSFGSVCRGTFRGEDVAVKRQRIEGQSVTDEKYMLSELAILRSLDHPRLLRYVGAALVHDPMVPGGDDGRPNVVITVTNYMPRGDFEHFLLDERASAAASGKRGPDERVASFVQWKLKVRMLHSASEGIAHLHERQLIHRDIKAANLLLDDDDRAIVCDFGFARKMASEAHQAKRDYRLTLLGTADYMSPELTLGEKYDEKVDVYSFGIIMLEMATNCAAGQGVLERRPHNCFDLDFAAIRRKIASPIGRSGVLTVPPPLSLVELGIQCCAYEPVRFLKDAFCRALVPAHTPLLVSSAILCSSSFAAAPLTPPFTPPRVVPFPLLHHARDHDTFFLLFLSAGSPPRMSARVPKMQWSGSRS